MKGGSACLCSDFGILTSLSTTHSTILIVKEKAHCLRCIDCLAWLRILYIPIETLFLHLSGIEQH